MSPRVDALDGPQASVLPHLVGGDFGPAPYEQGQRLGHGFTSASTIQPAPIQKGFWISEEFVRGARAALDTLAELNGTTNTGDIYDATIAREIRRQQVERQTQ